VCLFLLRITTVTTVTEDEVCNAVMSIKSNAAGGVDEILLSFIKSLLPVLLGTLTYVFNHIFTCSKFPAGCCPREIFGS
jgi:hypothetical protein